MSVNHYENFPVASMLCPPDLRPAISAIYAFARTADDLADEGDLTPERRLAQLTAYGADLRAMCRGRPVSNLWPLVFEPLRRVMHRYALPQPLLNDLLSAFEQDVVKHEYADRAELLDYCRRSANPIGRLLLHLYCVDGAQALRQSDAICSALQLINFWQDLSVDAPRGRLYVPATDCARHQVAPGDLLMQRDAPRVRALVADLANWAREMMCDGAPLVHSVPGRAGWELRLVVQGGLRILDKIEALNFNSLNTRPRLDWTDAPRLLWRAMWMRRVQASVVSTPV